MVRRYEQGEQLPLFVGSGSSGRGRSCSYSHSSWSSLERGSTGIMGHTGRGDWIVWYGLYGATMRTEEH